MASRQNGQKTPRTIPSKGSTKLKKPASPASGGTPTPRRREQRRSPWDRPLCWVEGQREGGVWIPLYCYPDELQAKHVMRRLVVLPEDSERAEKEGLVGLVDYRIHWDNAEEVLK